MFWCWHNVCDAGPILIQHMVNATCVSGRQWYEHVKCMTLNTCWVSGVPTSKIMGQHWIGMTQTSGNSGAHVCLKTVQCLATPWMLVDNYITIYLSKVSLPEIICIYIWPTLYAWLYNHSYKSAHKPKIREWTNYGRWSGNVGATPQGSLIMTDVLCFLHLAPCHTNVLFHSTITAICLNYSIILVIFAPVGRASLDNSGGVNTSSGDVCTTLST